MGNDLPEARLVRHPLELASQKKTKMDFAVPSTPDFSPLVSGLIGGGIVLVTLTVILSITLCMCYCKVDSTLVHQRHKPGRSLSSTSEDVEEDDDDGVSSFEPLNALTYGSASFQFQNCLFELFSVLSVSDSACSPSELVFVPSSLLN